LRTEIHKSLDAICSSADDTLFSFNGPAEAPDPAKNKRDNAESIQEVQVLKYLDRETRKVQVDWKIQEKKSRHYF
jgi:hypothetical protein